MKKIASILLVLISMLSFAGCQKTMYDEADFIEQARKEYNIANAETAVITYVGESVEGDKALLWFVSGNENQGHTYLPMSCFMCLLRWNREIRIKKQRFEIFV